MATPTRELPGKRPLIRLPTPVEQFLQSESASGIILVSMALIAFLWANSPWSHTYFDMKHATTGIQIGTVGLLKPLELWVNDLLMALFFFLVGLEIKREVLIGELAGFRKAALPIAAALGGMIAPALIYLAITWNSPEFVDGWGVPMATDIAFAVGVLALLGNRVPLALKVFLLALAIVDDLGAVIVIAVFYTEEVSIISLIISFVFVGVAYVYGRRGGTSAFWYTIIGLVAWYFMLKSGVHATIAGVLMAMTIPMIQRMTPEELKSEIESRIGGQSFEEVVVHIEDVEALLSRSHSPLHNFEHALHPYSAYFIMPIFALFNAGVAVTGGEGALVSLATLGVFLGLLLGKPIGVMLFVGLAVLLRITRLPDGVTWSGVFGVAMLAAIGFTMALFIANLAFDQSAALDQAKIGILSASVVAAFVGLYALKRGLPKEANSG